MTAEPRFRHPHDPLSRGAVESRVCQLAVLHPPRRFDRDAVRPRAMPIFVEQEGLVLLEQHDRTQSGYRCRLGRCWRFVRWPIQPVDDLSEVLCCFPIRGGTGSGIVLDQNLGSMALALRHHADVEPSVEQLR
jgi:hypothetical protein